MPAPARAKRKTQKPMELMVSLSINETLSTLDEALVDGEELDPVVTHERAVSVLTRNVGVTKLTDGPALAGTTITHAHDMESDVIVLHVVIKADDL